MILTTDCSALMFEILFCFFWLFSYRFL